MKEREWSVEKQLKSAKREEPWTDERERVRGGESASTEDVGVIEEEKKERDQGTRKGRKERATDERERELVQGMKA